MIIGRRYLKLLSNYLEFFASNCPLMRPLLWFNLLINTFYTLLTIYFMVFKLNLHETMNFLPMLMFFMFGLVIGVIVIKDRRNAYSLIEELENLKWPTETQLPDLDYIHRTEKFAYLLFFVSNLSTALGTIFTFPILKDSKYYLCIYYVIENYIPIWKLGLSYSFAQTNLLFAAVNMIPGHLFGYSSFLAVIHIKILVEELKKIKPYKYDNNTDLEKYNCLVTRKLKFVIQKQLELRRIGNEFLQILKITGDVFAITGVFLAGSFVLSVYMFPEHLKYGYPRWVCLILGSAASTFEIVWSAQCVENESNTFCATLYTLPYMDFNKKNLKLFIIIQEYTKTPFKVNFNLFTVNFTLLIVILKPMSQFLVIARYFLQKFKQ